MKSKSILVLSILFFGLFLVFYHQASAATSQVNVGQGGTNFSPSTLTITRGDTVNWVWVGGLHNVTSGSCPGGICTSDGKFNSGGPFTPAHTFSFTFNSSGTYPYFCSVHLSAMQGTIVVQDPLLPAEVPEANSVVLMLSGGVGLASYLALKWRARKRDL